MKWDSIALMDQSQQLKINEGFASGITAEDSQHLLKLVTVIKKQKLWKNH
jgi:hypothetical protein